MASHIRRRELIVALGAAAAWALPAHTQQAAMPVIGFLHPGWPTEGAHLVAAFKDGLGEAGFVEGQNVAVEYRWAQGKYDRLPELASELVRRQVAVIAATGGEPSPRAAKGATATIPIVFSMGTDPVRLGLVASINQPGGNITGVNFFSPSWQQSGLGCCMTCCPRPP